MALGGFSNITKIPELRKRILFTLGMLAVYRIGVFITAPGVDRNAMRAAVQKSGGLLNLFNLFSGGALENYSIFALGIMPYVSSSIIFQLLGLVSKQVEELRREGELTKKLTIKAHRASATAKEKIEKAGGSFELIVTSTAAKAAPAA